VQPLLGYVLATNVLMTNSKLELVYYLKAALRNSFSSGVLLNFFIMFIVLVVI